jgi:hypothetical protein
LVCADAIGVPCGPEASPNEGPVAVPDEGPHEGPRGISFRTWLASAASVDADPGLGVVCVR